MNDKKKGTRTSKNIYNQKEKIKKKAKANLLSYFKKVQESLFFVCFSVLFILFFFFFAQHTLAPFSLSSFSLHF